MYYNWDKLYFINLLIYLQCFDIEINDRNSSNSIKDAIEVFIL